MTKGPSKGCPQIAGWKTLSVEDRFWAQVSIGSPQDCWNWTGNLDPGGYGKIGGGGKTLAVHRLSFEIHNGPIPGGMEICHRCDNRRCVNPAHLFLGSRWDNAADMVSKGRGTRGRKGKEKISVQDVVNIRQSSCSSLDIANAYGLSYRQVLNIRNGTNWRTVAG